MRCLFYSSIPVVWRGMRLNPVQVGAVNLIDVPRLSVCAECLLVWDFKYIMTTLILGLSVYLKALYFGYDKKFRHT